MIGFKEKALGGDYFVLKSHTVSFCNSFLRNKVFSTGTPRYFSWVPLNGVCL